MELSQHACAFVLHMGAAMEDDGMSADMVADAALWFLSATAIAFITFGCWMTKPKPKVVEQHDSEAVMNRAA
jgi:hypothetical protein